MLDNIFPRVSANMTKIKIGSILSYVYLSLASYHTIFGESVQVPNSRQVGLNSKNQQNASFFFFFFFIFISNDDFCNHNLLYK